MTQISVHILMCHVYLPIYWYVLYRYFIYLYLSCNSWENNNFFLKLTLVSDLLYGKYNLQFIYQIRVVSDLSPTLGKIGHRWFKNKKWYPWWQNQWFRLCNQRSHNSYKLFWKTNPQKILLTIFNFDLNGIKCPILPFFMVPYGTSPNSTV